MDADLAVTLGRMGAAAAVGLAAAGSSLGVGAAGPAAVGAWKKCYAQNKAAPFILFAFIGAPMSQTIYGMILMGWINTAIDAAMKAGLDVNWGGALGAGVFGGLGIGISAWYQGVIGAGASDAMTETGKGFGNYLMVLGIIETLAILVLVFIPPAFRLAGGMP
jgi:V/A-type H+-transporting ATPase subunit K